MFISCLWWSLATFPPSNCRCTGCSLSDNVRLNLLWASDIPKMFFPIQHWKLDYRLKQWGPTRQLLVQVWWIEHLSSLKHSRSSGTAGLLAQTTPAHSGVERSGAEQRLSSPWPVQHSSSYLHQATKSPVVPWCLLHCNRMLPIHWVFLPPVLLRCLQLRILTRQWISYAERERERWL